MCRGIFGALPASTRGSHEDVICRRSRICPLENYQGPCPFYPLHAFNFALQVSCQVRRSSSNPSSMPLTPESCSPPEHTCVNPKVLEPMVDATVITPADSLGAMLTMLNNRRGRQTSLK